MTTDAAGRRQWFLHNRTKTNTGVHVEINEGHERRSLKELCKFTPYVRNKVDFVRKGEVAQNRKKRLFNKNTSFCKVDETMYRN